MNNTCATCYNRIVPITPSKSARLRCMYDLHTKNADDTCAYWKQEFRAQPKEEEKKNGGKGRKNTERGHMD